MNVNAGKRVEVAIASYSGVAGFTEFSDGSAALSFPAASLSLSPGEKVSADGRTWRVEKVGASKYLRGFKLVELRPVEGS